MKYVTPSIAETAFNCPRCGALAKQFWYRVLMDAKTQDAPLPHLITKSEIPHYADGYTAKSPEDEAAHKGFVKWLYRMAAGDIFSEEKNGYESVKVDLFNAHVSKCFNCDGVAFWISDRLIYPQTGISIPANPDMSEDIRKDYEEASLILEQSPRGAAALLRLAIQKLCKELGQPGENINKDIKALVASGLDTRVQQALDVVRVIGNSAVHPGQIDLRDNKDTATMLFKLINLIVERTISEPKHVREVYEALPLSALEAIKNRDGKQE
ncbi:MULTISPECIES: DUF4145 domain-containing protein [Pseudomonas]|uniref:DUF4145 domain-containing protein n=1 Tax=Pseudomonas TaxID=286 RepID=UPI001B4D10AC|nr:MULTISPECIES: DUF4145 domain-containing protein [unclassified Pseudomonas]MBP1128440.1 hypothetical protein [Pseudomonas sp. PvP025]MDQ0397377.1 hypothetical protein [Pseudomonas sp. PvP006]